MSWLDDEDRLQLVVDRRPKRKSTFAVDLITGFMALLALLALVGAYLYFGWILK